jgi:hypothetical protein
LLLNANIAEAQEVGMVVKMIHSSAHFARGDLLGQAYGTPTFRSFMAEFVE